MRDDQDIIEPNWKKFYNYRYWREEQRRQLTIVSNVYFALASAMIGFTIKYLVKFANTSEMGCTEKTFLVIGIVFNILSLVLYVRLTDNKLNDYRKTAQMIEKGENSADDIDSNTSAQGTNTWELFKLQKVFLIIGFVFCALGFAFLIFLR